MRYALGIEYDGSDYHGWQRQEGAPTVQAAVERALSTVANHTVSVICAGRTDTGVHALGQVIHFDSDADRSEDAWVLGGNANLPTDIRVRWAKCVDDKFHARYSATARCYHYIIDNRPVRPAIFREGVTWHYHPLNERHMHKAAQTLIGEHDFSAFRGADCQSKTPMRNVQRIAVKRHGDLILIEVKANAFLHHMVRNIVGVLLAIGEGKQGPRWAQEVLASKDRTLAGVTAPAAGLYLMAVEYPKRYSLLHQKRQVLLPFF